MTKVVYIGKEKTHVRINPGDEKVVAKPGQVLEMNDDIAKNLTRFDKYTFVLESEYKGKKLKPGQEEDEENDDEEGDEESKKKDMKAKGKK